MPLISLICILTVIGIISYVCEKINISVKARKINKERLKKYDSLFRENQELKRQLTQGESGSPKDDNKPNTQQDHHDVVHYDNSIRKLLEPLEYEKVCKENQELKRQLSLFYDKTNSGKLFEVDQNSTDVIYTNIEEFEFVERSFIEQLKKENQIFKSNLTAFPYMASIVADYETIGFEKIANSLNWGNNQQRAKKVASIIELRQQAKELLEKYKVSEYQLSYLKGLYPGIEDILEADYRTLPQSHDFEEITNYDTVRNWLSKEEYLSLSTSERNQRALDNYVNSHNKTAWQIGRDYEMYIGYRYKLKGYKIEYHGIEKGLDDLGRDIIATKPNESTLIIQCKYWSTRKTIHEKHILQLYGTYVCYQLENPQNKEKVHPILITNTAISEQAKKYADYLNVSVVENYALSKGNLPDYFPRIKCNIGKDEKGAKTRIYHLPFDQQYDNVKIEAPGEFYAFTVKEAESKGFRRAFRWTNFG